MYKTFIAIVLLTTVLACLPVSVLAESMRYTPPPRKGTIYIVFRFKAYSSRDQMKMNENTRVSVRWGSYSRSSSYGRGRLSLKMKDGFVIALRHLNDDAVQMTVESEGPIVSIAQLDSPPSEWKDSRYDKYNW